MSRDIPEFADLRQLARTGRGFKGSWPVARMPRVLAILKQLNESIKPTSGEQFAANENADVAFTMQFDVDVQDIRFCEIGIETQLQLICQRSLERYNECIDRQSALGLIDSMDEDVSLPDRYEPYLISETPFKLVTIIEDELILALPLVPVKPGEDPVDLTFGGDETDQTTIEDKPNLFAALASLKDHTT